MATGMPHDGACYFDKHVLTRVFTHLRQAEHGWHPNACQLVCKQWRDAYRESVSQVQAFRVRAAIELGFMSAAPVVEAAVAWVRRHASHATSADVDIALLHQARLDAPATGMAFHKLLHACSATLTALRLVVPPGAAAYLYRWLDECSAAQLTQLTLDLHQWEEGWREGDVHLKAMEEARLTAACQTPRTLQALALRGGWLSQRMDQLLLDLPAATLTSLTLDGTQFRDGLQALQEGHLTRLSRLQHLALCGLTSSQGSYAQHARLPPGITQLTQLTRLDFARNGFVPRLPALPALPNLVHLDLGRSLLPPSAALDLSAATGLTFLSLTGFVADKVDLAQLPCLQQLSFAECHLFEPPPGLEALSALTAVDLSRGLNRKLAIPLAAAYPPQLRELRAAASGLRQPPLALASLQALSYLDLSHNPLTAGMERLAALAPSLRIVDLSACGLRQAPAALAALSRLTWLNLGGNSGLDVEQLCADILPRLCSLQVLLLPEVGMRAIPQGISALQSSLTLLDLGRNPGLGGIGALGSLSGLRRLQLAGCQLQELPWEGLHSLTWLGLADGGLVEGLEATPYTGLVDGGKPYSGLSKLHELDISGCQLSALPGEVTRLPALQRLCVGPGAGQVQQCFGKVDEAWLVKEFGVDHATFSHNLTVYKLRF